MQKTLAKILKRPFLVILHLVSGLIPRDRTLWIFGSWNGARFADNARAVFLRAVQDKHVRCAWLSSNPDVINRLRAAGLPAYHTNSLQGLWLRLRAGVYVFDAYSLDLGYWGSLGAKKVNLWHGMPIKKIQSDIDIPFHPMHRAYHGPFLERIIRRMWSPWLYEKPDLMIATSPCMQRILSGAFRIPVTRIPITGYPRIDSLVAQNGSPSPLDAEWASKMIDMRSSGVKILAYLPTFRDCTASDHTIPIEWDEFNALLQKRNAVLLLKLHSNDVARLPDLTRYSNILLADHHVDFTPLLRWVDVLITDYSSVWVDFLVLNRPIVFFAYDLDEYLAQSRSMYFDYISVTPGPKARNFAELVSILDSILIGHYDDQWAAERQERLAQFYSRIDDRAAERVCHELYRHFVRRDMGK